MLSIEIAVQWIREAESAGTKIELRVTKERGPGTDNPILSVTSIKGEIGKMTLVDYIEAHRLLLNEEAA